MDPTLQEKADEIFEKALEEQDARDPREFYRERLRELKGQGGEAYEEAVTYYQEILVPRVASSEAEPVRAWLEYGRKLAELCAAGRTVMVDDSGRSSPYEPDDAPGLLVLHLPRSKKERPLLVGLPKELSPAQKATYDLLVAGRQTLRQ